MPTYEYRCPDGHRFEVFQRMSDEPVADCPECGSRAERLLSPGGGLLFKGSGFYITDYRSDSYKERARKEEGASAGKGSDGSGGEGSDGSGGKGSDGSGGSGSDGSGGKGSDRPGGKDKKGTAGTGSRSGGATGSRDAGSAGSSES